MTQAKETDGLSVSIAASLKAVGCLQGQRSRNVMAALQTLRVLSSSPSHFKPAEIAE